MNRLYEGMFLLDANETSKRWNEMESHIDTLLGKIDADVQFKERWPSQKLAYEVKGTRKGTYYLTYFHASPEKIDDLRRDAELSEHVLRLMVIQEDWLEEEMTRRQAAAQRRSEAGVAGPEQTEGDAGASEPAKTESAGAAASAEPEGPAEAAEPDEYAAAADSGDSGDSSEFGDSGDSGDSSESAEETPARSASEWEAGAVEEEPAAQPEAPEDGDGAAEAEEKPEA